MLCGFPLKKNTIKLLSSFTLRGGSTVCITSSGMYHPKWAQNQLPEVRMAVRYLKALQNAVVANIFYIIY